MGLRDLLYAAPIVGLALWILWRSTVRSGGRCAGCSSGCSPKQRGELVRLGPQAGTPGALEREKADGCSPRS